MATYKAPGVYVEEVPLIPASIAQEPTSVVAFVGYAGPGAAGSTPVNIRSISEFISLFGNNSGNKYLFDSITLFYANGGGNCYVVPVGAATDPVSFAALTQGLEESKKLPVQLIAIPDACLLPAPEFYLLQQQMLATAALLQDRFAILDTLQPAGNADSDGELYRAGIGNNNLKWGAVYYPWLILSGGKQVPPCGAIAGLYALTDNARGVWRAPANITVNGITGVTVSITHDQQNTMNVSLDGKSINAIRAFSGQGVLVWGARTLDGNSQDWRYISIRRTITMIENSIKNSTGWVLFEPNDANTWVRIKSMIENYLLVLWRQGGLAGAKPDEAFSVDAGLGTTMTALDIQEGRLIISIKLAITRPAEFIVITLVHTLQQR